MNQKLITSCASAATAVALIAPTIGIAQSPFNAVPLAQAQTCDVTHRNVESGTLEWGVKESFRKYVTGGFAHGSATPKDGATNSGNGFAFPAVSSAIGSGNQGTVTFGGSVNFKAHGELLNITLSNIKLRVNGSTGQLSADYAATEFKGMNVTTVGKMKTGKDVVFANVRFNSAPDFDKDQVNFSGSTTLTQSGVPVFGGFYDAGEAFDDLSGRLSVGDACGEAPSDSGAGNSDAASQGTGQTDSGATEGVPGLLGTINDSLVEVNGLLVNSENLMNNADSLFATAHGSSSSTQTGNGADSGASQGAEGTPSGAGEGGSVTAAAPQGATSGFVPAVSASAGSDNGQGSANSVAGAAAPSAGSAAGDGGQCVAGSQIGVESAQALWGVRASFRNYLRSSIAEGGWRLNGVGFNGNQYQFSGNSGAVNPGQKSGNLNFGGAIQFYGHGGVLDTRMSGLEIRFSGDSGQLLANVRANDTDGNARDFGRVALANLSMKSLSVSDSSVSGTAAATLTSEGAAAFGGFYPAGDALDDIEFAASVSAQADCATSAGGTAGASTVSFDGQDNGGESTPQDFEFGEGGAQSGDLFEDSATGQGQNNPFRINSAQVNSEGFFNLNSALSMLIVLAAFVMGAFARGRFGKKAGE